MDTYRIKQEIDELADKYYTARSNHPDIQGYELRDFNYPDGWVLRDRHYWLQRRGVPPGPPHVAPLLFRIPDSYPYSQPYVYVPDTLDYTQGDVNHLLKESPYPGWQPWCVRDLNWDPRKHTIAWLLGLVQLSFSHPEAEDPTIHLQVSRLEDYRP
jgi:hypothetical protein